MSEDQQEQASTRRAWTIQDTLHVMRQNYIRQQVLADGQGNQALVIISTMAN